MHGLALLRQLYNLGIIRMEEVSRDVEPPTKRVSALHSVRTSPGTECAWMRRKAAVV